MYPTRLRAACATYCSSASDPRRDLARPREQVGRLVLGHRHPVALFHPALPSRGKPMVSAARAIVSSQAKPGAAGSAAADIGASARWTDSSVHMPSAEPWSAARNVARIPGGSITAAAPPCPTDTSPLIPAAAGLARYTTSGAT